MPHPNPAPLGTLAPPAPAAPITAQAVGRDREAVPPEHNPLGLQGIEFIEYATQQPQALGQVLERMGFMPVARHRSREVTLYRQGDMNLVVNAHAPDARGDASRSAGPVLSAVAFRVRDALAAHTHCVAMGAWDIPSQVAAMELHIPAIQGPGGSRFYFVDRVDRFSIFDIDFEPIPTVDAHPPALSGAHYFGVVQYIGSGRSADWLAYYERLLGFEPIPDEERFGILPKGKLMKSPCGQFRWQLIEPDPGMDDTPLLAENLERIGLGVRDVPDAVAQLRARGVRFVDAGQLHPEDRGALTRHELGTVSFELVHHTA